MLGNSFGRLFRVYACGESYGEALQIIVDGVPAGIPLTDADIQKELDRRRPGQSQLDSPRGETDKVKIVAGLLEGITTGAPVGMIIYNVDRQPIHVDQYRAVKDIMRPGHAEHTYFYKYGQYADWCGAGRSSGRESACRVAAGALAKLLLARENIQVAGYVKELCGIRACEVTFDEILENGEKNEIRCPDLETAKKMIARCFEIKEDGDTAGGVVEIRARNVPPGLGEPVFDKLSATIAHGIMSIGAVKGFEIGAGFAVAKMKGSECNDIPYIDNGRIRFKTNRSGGIDGGISNGEEIIVRMAVKPTSTISIEQDSVNLPKLEPAKLAAITRRDPTICARIVAVGEAMVAIALVDHLMMWRGYDSMQKFDHPWRKLTEPHPPWGK
ncbi:MAG TPA: chorismate synthase [bacterium]|nr:chorismate synthase [bacterium]HQL64090.1 chorismate synthase [bacterium]